MHNNSPTAAGQTKHQQSDGKHALIDAINQLFTLFRLNYHNQYLKAFGNMEELNEVKRLWLEMLGRFDAPTILAAAKRVIENNEYLPTLHTMIHHCEKLSSDMHLPDAHAAYIEACRAPSPKAEQKWTHPVVYHAGKQCDWYFLQSSPESVAFPIFRQQYNELCTQVRSGLKLTLPPANRIEAKPAKVLDKETNQAKLDALKSALKL